MKKIIVTLVGALVCALGVTVGAPAAYAASGCGNSCDNRDAYTYNVCWVFEPHTCVNLPDEKMVCASDDQQVIDFQRSGLFRVIMLYSPSCRTAWAMWIGVCTNGCIEGMWMESYYTSGALRLKGPLVSSTATNWWTPMLNDAGLLDRVCVSVTTTSGTTKYCSSKY
jgi:hypothetical protein